LGILSKITGIFRRKNNSSGPAAEYVSEADIRTAVFKVWCTDDVGGLKYLNTLRY
jgi:hypothetical protein